MPEPDLIGCMQELSKTSWMGLGQAARIEERVMNLKKEKGREWD